MGVAEEAMKLAEIYGTAQDRKSRSSRITSRLCQKLS